MMTPEQSREAVEGWVRASQNLMQGFFGQIAAQQDMVQSGLQSSLARSAGEHLAELQQEHAQLHVRLWASMLSRKAGDVTEPIFPPSKGDKRFGGEEWLVSPMHDYMRQAYLINAHFLSEVAENLTIPDHLAKDRVRFLTRQYIDALAPSNFVMSNPEVIQRAVETNGESLAQGMLNLISDVEKGGISMTDESAFEVGNNLAVTPGKVVFENALMQLIQYAPLTENVFERPLLMVPPCINKYYILDLQPENSFVRYLVEQGITVFMISWRNPKAAQAQLRWDDYLEQGIFVALKAVRAITGEKRPNALGFCIGGTMLATALSVLRARGEDPVESATLLTTLLDFSDTGDIACFIDETSVAAREATIGNGGLMGGRELSRVFSSLRPNDLVWNYVVDNYLKGNRPPAFDLLFWNADSTNLPGPLAVFYLRNMYLENRLCVPGRIRLCGETVDLGRIVCPIFMVASREDHIVPWGTSYLGKRFLGGNTTFVLGASGHIAGIVNHPARNKRSYWCNDQSPATAEEWMSGAKEHKGSWWPCWIEWLGQRSGGQVPARQHLGSRDYKPGENAPGQYVKEKI